MDNWIEKRQRFELLLQQTNISPDIVNDFFADGYIDQVEVSRSNSQWTFILAKKQLLPHDIYTNFCRTVREQYAHVAQIDFVMKYDEAEVQTDILVETYWGLCNEWIQAEVASVNGWLSKAKLEANGEIITLSLLDQIGMEMAKKKSLDLWIQRFYRDYFARELTIRFRVSESNEAEYGLFAQQIEEEERNVTQTIVTSIEKVVELSQAADSDLMLTVGYEIKDIPVPIQEVREEEKKITLQGTIFGLEMKVLKTGTTLFQFYITDYSDSLMVKAFVKSKEDLKIYNLLANGKWIKVRGKVEYDRFGQPPELMLIPQDINEVAAPPERMDHAEVKRVEFHLHTSMSTMDGITPVGDYIKTAAKWGHKAIAVTDHSCIQAFPDANKAGKKHDIKIIYGV
jgi:DNA polymerase-3 subunit alpha (Gram-positive type)